MLDLAAVDATFSSGGYWIGHTAICLWHRWQRTRMASGLALRGLARLVGSAAFRIGSA
jgi:hypothetical protein